MMEQVLVHLSYMKSTMMQSPAPHFFLNTARTDFWVPPNVTDYKIRDIVNIIRCSFSECEEAYWTKISHTNSVLFFFFRILLKEFSMHTYKSFTHPLSHRCSNIVIPTVYYWHGILSTNVSRWGYVLKEKKFTSSPKIE